MNNRTDGRRLQIESGTEEAKMIIGRQRQQVGTQEEGRSARPRNESEDGAAREGKTVPEGCHLAPLFPQKVKMPT